MLWRLVLGIVLNWAASLFQKPPEGPKASTLADFGIPKAVEGSRIMDFAGTRWVPDSTVAFYGDFASTPIREKAKKK